MKVLMRVLTILMLFAFACPAALAETPEPQRPVAPESAERPDPLPALDINAAEIESGLVPETLEAEPLDGDAAIASPMMLEIRNVIEAGDLEIAELLDRADAARGTRTAGDAHGEIAAVKRRIELDILAIQARHAREAGDEDLAARIDAAIDAIVSPPAPPAPATERPVPARGR